MRARTHALSLSLLALSFCGSADGGAAGPLLLGVILVLPPLLAFYSLRRQWQELPKELTTGAVAKTEHDGAKNRLRRAWIKLLEKALAKAAVTEANGPLGAALRQAVESLRTFARPTEELAITGANDGKLRTWLGVFGRRAIYVLIFPGKHEQPSAFRAHPGLSYGWLRHMELLRARLASEADVEAVLALIFLVPADAQKGELLVSFDDGTSRVAPSVMLDAQEAATSGGWTVLHERIQLDFERMEAS